MRARLAALEMELEALKRGSDAGFGGLAGADVAAAIKQQTEVLKDTLSSRGTQSSVTAVRALWPGQLSLATAVIHVMFLSSTKNLRTSAHWLTTVRACPSESSWWHFAGVVAGVGQRLQGSIEEW